MAATRRQGDATCAGRKGSGLDARHRARRERDVEREIRAHLDLEAEAHQDTGMTAEEARDAAHRAFGNRTLVSEDLRAIWGTPSLDALLQDVRYAARTMRRAPGFASAAVGSSALGIGACATIFAILNFAMLQRLPVDEPSGLFSVSETNLRTGEAGDQLSYPDLLDLRRARSFDGGGEALARMFQAFDAGPMFGMGGFQLLPFYDAARRLDLDHHLINDERAGGVRRRCLCQGHRPGRAGRRHARARRHQSGDRPGRGAERRHADGRAGRRHAIATIPGRT